MDGIYFRGRPQNAYEIYFDHCLSIGNNDLQKTERVYSDI